MFKKIKTLSWFLSSFSRTHNNNNNPLFYPCRLSSFVTDEGRSRTLVSLLIPFLNPRFTRPLVNIVHVLPFSDVSMRIYQPGIICISWGFCLRLILILNGQFVFLQKTVGLFLLPRAYEDFNRKLLNCYSYKQKPVNQINHRT